MELLPCPHCGGFDTLAVSGIQIGTKTTWRTICDAGGSGCGAQGGTALTKHAAAAAWNRRTPADPALLALSKLGALMCQDACWPKPPESKYQDCEYIDLSPSEVTTLLDEARLMLGRDGTPEPGVRAAIARLLAPDGAESEARVCRWPAQDWPQRQDGPRMTGCGRTIAFNLSAAGATCPACGGRIVEVADD